MGESLSREEAKGAMDAIMSGQATAAQMGAFLMALRVRGETTEEIAGAADSMRSHSLCIHTDRHPLVDTCGTGGDGTGTFNISTAAAFVVAGAGVAVAKHGNRSVSSRCGSADVLEALGARIDLPPQGVEACLEETGVGFLFAPRHHGAMKHAAGVRKDLAMRTLFNLLGPLCNPAQATHQLMGVYDPVLTEPLATVLSLLGSEGAMVVHGDGGLDEISLSGPTRVSEWRGGEMNTYAIEPGELGVEPAPLDTIKGGDAAQNAAVITSLLQDGTGPARDVVCMNAGAALYVANRSETLEGGVAMALDSIESGRAAEALASLVDFSRSWMG
jgi:anthranilate phosphoribosyltransferase